jgi:hypothetical protein
VEEAKADVSLGTARVNGKNILPMCECSGFSLSLIVLFYVVQFIICFRRRNAQGFKGVDNSFVGQETVRQKRSKLLIRRADLSKVSKIGYISSVTIGEREKKGNRDSDDRYISGVDARLRP